MAQLNDPLTQIRFGDFQAQSFKVMVEQGLFGRHGFGFNYFLYLVVPGDAGDNLIGFLGRAGFVHNHAGLGRIALEISQQAVHPGNGHILGPGHVGHQAVHIYTGKGILATGAISHREFVHGLTQKLIGQGGADLPAVSFQVLGLLHRLSST